MKYPHDFGVSLESDLIEVKILWIFAKVVFQSNSIFEGIELSLSDLIFT